MGGQAGRGSPPTVAGCVHGTRHDSDASGGEGRAHGRGSGHRTLGRARSEGGDAARRSAASPAGRAKGELGSPGDPVRVSTAVRQRQFGPGPGGRRSSRRVAALGDRVLPRQGSFPLVDLPDAGRGISRVVRGNGSAVVAEGPLDQGPSERLGVQKWPRTRSRAVARADRPAEGKHRVSDRFWSLGRRASHRRRHHRSRTPPGRPGGKSGTPRSGPGSPG
jgi:hypothetical protein